MPNFDPVSIFNKLSPRRLQELSNHFNLGFTIPKDAKKVSGIEINAEWRALLNREEAVIKEHQDPNDPNSPLVKRYIASFQDFLQQLHNMVIGKCDVMQVARELLENGNTDFSFPEGFEDWSGYDKGAFIFLDNKDFWETLSSLVQARNCNSSRLWVDYNNLPARTPKAKDEDLRNLEKIFERHFKKDRPKTHCHINSYIRKTQYYYFASLRDNMTYVESYTDQAGEEQENPTALSFAPPLRIIFVYDEVSGQFSIYGDFDKKDFDPLAKELVLYLVDYDGQFDRIKKPEYCLEGLKERNFNWRTEQADCVKKPKLNEIIISPVDDEGLKMSFSNRKRNIHDCLDEYLNRERLPNDAFSVQGAIIRVEPYNHPKKIKPFSFRITPTSCGLKSLEDNQRELGEKIVRQAGLIRFPDIPLSDVLRAVKSQEAVLSESYVRILSSDMMEILSARGLLDQVDDAGEVIDGAEHHEIFAIPRDDGSDPAFSYLGTEGAVHSVEKADQIRYRLNYKPIVECVHESLGCVGNSETVIDNLVWYVGTSGSEHRDVYVVRDWDCKKEVQDEIKKVHDTALVLHIGGKPDIVQIGKRRSDMPKNDDEQKSLDVQYYQLDRLINYTQENGLVFHADIIRLTLDDMLNARGTRKIIARSDRFKKDDYRNAIETWLWSWIDARLKAAKVVAYGDGENPDVNLRYLEYDVLSQKEVIEAVSKEFPKPIPEKAYTEAKNVWKQDKVGFGPFFLAVTETFVKRRPQKGKLCDPKSIERLNDFYRMYSTTIDTLRKQRPTGA